MDLTKPGSVGIYGFLKMEMNLALRLFLIGHKCILAKKLKTNFKIQEYIQ